MTKKDKECYLVHDYNSKKSAICKVLNEYDDGNEAKKDLVDLLTNKVTEDELLQKFNKKKGL